MKPLFERLSDLEHWNVKDSIHLSLQQIVESGHIRDREAPEGVLSFGGRNPVDLDQNKDALDAYAATLRRRIAAFEPRIAVRTLSIVDETVVIEATLKSTQEIFIWRR